MFVYQDMFYAKKKLFYLALLLLFAMYTYDVYASDIKKESAVLFETTSSGIIDINASSDGRIIVAATSNKVWFFDGYESQSFTDSSTNYVTTTCTSIVNVFAVNVSSHYLVHAVCNNGTVDQFWLDENDETSNDSYSLSFTPSSVTTVTLTTLTTVSSASISSDSSKLFLAGKTSLGTTGITYIGGSSSTTASETSFATFTTYVAIDSLVYDSAKSYIIAVDSSGVPYIILSGSTVTASVSSVSCNVAPRNLILISSNLLLMLGSGKDSLYILSVADGTISCSEYDWGYSSVYGISRSKYDGTGNATDKIYLRHTKDNIGKISVFTTPTTESQAKSLVESSSFSTAKTSLSTDVFITSDNARGYLYSLGQGISVLTAGPWFQVASSMEPIPVSESNHDVELTFTSDSDIADCFHFSLDTPYNSSCSGNAEFTEDPLSSTPLSLIMDLDLISNLETGLNRVFIYAEDSDGDLGWTSLRINEIEVPSALEGITSNFGDQSAYIEFEKSDNEQIDDYEIVVSTEPFDIEDISDLESFEAGGITYPVNDTVTWPMSISIWSSDSEPPTSCGGWSEDGDIVKYRLCPLENGTTYYITIRALAEGEPSDWSSVFSVTPQETCGATCLAGESGGFCSYVGPSFYENGFVLKFTRGFYLCLASLLFIVYKRRQKI